MNNKITSWNSYAAPFQSVMPTEMARLNEDAAGRLCGTVADFGCGSGKIIPYISTTEAIDQYIGIDMSPDMIKGAKWMARQFPGKVYRLIVSAIETMRMTPVDSAVSINSLYTWNRPVEVLKHIRLQIKPGGLMVLATINPTIDMPSLLEEARKEQVANPHWEAFARQNMEIYESPEVNLVELDDLVGIVKSVGFAVISAHSDYYGGGLNFLVLRNKG